MRCAAPRFWSSEDDSWSSKLERGSLVISAADAFVWPSPSDRETAIFKSLSLVFPLREDGEEGVHRGRDGTLPTLTRSCMFAGKAGLLRARNTLRLGSDPACSRQSRFKWRVAIISAKHFSGVQRRRRCRFDLSNGIRDYPWKFSSKEPFVRPHLAIEQVAAGYGQLEHYHDFWRARSRESWQWIVVNSVITALMSLAFQWSFSHDLDQSQSVHFGFWKNGFPKLDSSSLYRRCQVQILQIQLQLAVPRPLRAIEAY